MWFEFFRFDLRYQLRQPLLWIAGLLMGLVAFSLVYSDSMAVGRAFGNVHRNAPIVIADMFGFFSWLSMFVVTVFIGGTVLRDFDFGVAELIFATHIRKRDYVLGRFCAGVVACMAIYLLIALGMVLGSLVPGNDLSRTGVFAIQPYWWSFTILVIPNLFFMASMQLWLATTTRSILYVFIGVLAFFVLWRLGGEMTRNLDNEWIAVLLDPFGRRALHRMSRYYSLVEVNAQLPPLNSFLLWNRLLWLSVSAIMLGMALRVFKLQHPESGKPLFRPRRTELVFRPPHEERLPLRTHLAFSWLTAVRQCWQIFRFDTLGVFRSVPFVVMLIITLVLFATFSNLVNEAWGTRPYPLTHQMLLVLGNNMQIALYLAVIFYGGELIFKERQYNVAEVTDAMPMPNWVPLLAKSLAVIGVVFGFIVVCALTSIVIQLIRGGVSLEPMLYVKGLALESIPFILMGLLAVAVQALANNKYLGHLLMVVVWASLLAFPVAHLEHNLYFFGGMPLAPYSDLNGYDHYLRGVFWFAGYWSLFTLGLLLLAQAAWVRGTSQEWRNRLRLARRRLHGGAAKVLLTVAAAFLATGGWIFYNTVILNPYLPSNVRKDHLASYEKQYRRYYGAAQPSITAVRAQVDIYPDQLAANINGHYHLENRTRQAIDTLYVQLNSNVQTQLAHLPPHRVMLDDVVNGFRIVKLDQALAPGSAMDMDFTVAIRNPGFSNDQGFVADRQLTEASAVNVLHNGTVLTSDEFFPHLGYQPLLELRDPADRHRHGLGKSQPMPTREDVAALHRNELESDADWVSFDTVVSTNANQTAVAPGDLKASWDKGGRRYFHYAIDGPALPFIIYASASWRLETAEWRGIPIEVYYGAKHPFNIEHMIDAVHRSLDYYVAHFGPYPLAQVRIVEIPRYAPESMPSPGMIASPEDIGFIADLRDASDVDEVAFMTARDMAQQWWGHQVVGADVQGSAMLTESLAQYSAMMVMEKRFGRAHLRRFLRHELDRYLANRSEERMEERPISQVDDKQRYIFDNKGALVFYRLRDEIGEIALDRALQRFLRRWRYATAPYPTAQDLLDCIRAETPADKQQLVTDLFERIVFYDNRVVSAHATQRPDGQWDVTMQLHLRKYETDGYGKESPRAYDEPVEIGVFSEAADGEESHENVLMLGKRQFHDAEPIVTVTVKDRPYEVGVDPFNILIDRVPTDNRKVVTVD